MIPKGVESRLTMIDCPLFILFELFERWGLGRCQPLLFHIDWLVLYFNSQLTPCIVLFLIRRDLYKTVLFELLDAHLECCAVLFEEFLHHPKFCLIQKFNLQRSHTYHFERKNALNRFLPFKIFLASIFWTILNFRNYCVQ